VRPNDPLPERIARTSLGQQNTPGSRLARPKDHHDGAGHTPLKQRPLAETYLQYVIAASRVLQAESGEGKVRFVHCLDLRKVWRMYVVAHYIPGIGQWLPEL
jgi:hypothetical protein